ncbi:TPA: thioesterase family protein [Pseudomonas putida]|nr:thioesterase family protein [Pseudomonas putida]
MSIRVPEGLTPLADLLARRVRIEQSVFFDIPADWLQGRTSFGGLIAACSAQAMRDVAGVDWDPAVRLLSLNANFVGPLTLGAVDVAVRVLRDGKNIRHILAQVSQNGQLGTVVTGVFGLARETSVPSHSPPIRQLPKSVEDSPPTPQIPGVVNFAKHMEFRWADGQLPYSGGVDWQSSVYARFPFEGDVPAELMTIILADSSPPPVLGRFKTPVLASTVSWFVELHAPAELPGSEAFWLVDKHTRTASTGYVNDTTTVWTPEGKLAAFASQVMAVFA